MKQQVTNKSKNLRMKQKPQAEFDLSAFELSCIILVMQKVNSEKWHKNKNGLYLDFHDQKILKRLVKAQENLRIKNALILFKVNT